MTKEEFKILFEQHFDSVRSYVFYRCGNEELATDIAQDCFMKIWEKRNNIVLSKVKGLLFKMASDLFINHYHSDKRARRLFANISFDDVDYSPEEILSFKQLKEKYEKLIEEMPENQRVVFLMSRIEELQYKEIAERLGLSIKAVEKRMGIALKYLRTSLTS